MEQVHDIKEAVALYDKGLSNLLGNATEWKEFLKFNSKFYKYKFHENLLLYAQDKNITACATFDEWKKVGRYVKPKPYSKTLKTIYQQNGRLYLKSVFDISSTNSKYDVDFKLWETTETETINILSNKLDIYLGNTQGKLSNIISSYLSDMIVNNELAETLELSKEQIYNDEFLSAFFESVITVVMNRCGAEYEPNLDTFENINDVQILKKLGYIVNKCSYDLIRIVELEIKEKLKKQEWEELFNERNNIKENEQNIGGNKTSEISRIDNDGNNKRDTRKLFSRDSESRTTNRRTIKNKISKTRYGRIYRTSTIRKHDTQLKNGTNEQYDRRKSKRNVDYGDGVVQTTLFNLPQINEELKKQTPVENTFSGYKVGDLVYLENDKPQYIRKIDVEKNQVLVSINPHTDVVLQRYSIKDFEDKLYNNSLNATSIENNKENDLEKLAEITEINPFTENDEMVQIPPPPAPFKISDDLKKDSIGLKKKYDENIAAIKLLKQLEQEDREATDEEKNILAKYNGWGGLSKAFEESSEQYYELQELLSPEEFKSSRESALTSFYTEPYIIDFMYKAIQRFGISGKCRILDPSAGVGNFLGRLPTELENSKITAIEKDNLTGRLLKKIYTNADVQIKGYEDTKLNNNYYDIAISNIPFGNFGVFDRNYDNSLQIHDYFFEKTLDKIKPGGIVAFITSRFTLDKQDSKAREYIEQKANFIGAVRLPNTAFKKIANTEAISDIIFLQKKGKELEYKENWIDTFEIRDGIHINDYFTNKRYMIKGNIDFSTNQYGETLDIVANGDLKEQLDETLKMLPSNIVDMQELGQVYIEEKGESIPVGEQYNNVKDYTYTEINGRIYYRINDYLYEQNKNQTAIERIKGLIKVKTALKNLIDIENKDVSDIDIIPYQTKLNQVYDEFVRKYGYITDRGNDLAFRNDADYPLLISLERQDKKTKQITKTDIFTKRTIKPYKEITQTETAKEGLIASINQRGKVDIKYIMKLCGKDYNSVIEELKGLIYHNPELAKQGIDEDLAGWETADQYLSRKCSRKVKNSRKLC